MVACTDTVVHPGAVMVHHHDATTTDSAVVGSWGLAAPTLAALVHKTLAKSNKTF